MAGDSAATRIQVEETEGHVDLEAAIAHEDALAATNDRIAAWMGKAPAPAGA